MHQRKYQWIRVVILTGLIAVWTGFWPVQDSLGEGNDTGGATSNRVEGVPNFRLDRDSGPMATYALRSCFEAMGFKYSYPRLAGVSGTAFKFVYDTTGAYEALRGLFPTDVLTSAAEQMGYKQAHWETGRSIDEVMDIIKSEIDAGRPLIAPNLELGAYDGFFVIAGYDLETGYLLIQGALREAEYDSVPIAEGWDGPTASPAGWASNPVFVFGHLAKIGGDGRAGKNAPSVAAAIEIMKGGEIEYGKHSGEGPYLAKAGPHTAGYGLRAFELLTDDIGHRPLVIMQGGEQHLDFDFLGRIDSQIGQMEHDRTQAHTFLRQLRTSLPPEKQVVLDELIGTLQALSLDAKALREMFWQVVPPDLATAASVVSYTRESSSFVLMVPPRAGVIADLKSMGEPVFESTWGWVMVADSPEKRMDARLLVRAIVSRERNSIRMLEDLLPDVDTRIERERPEGQKRPGRNQ